MTTTLRFRSDMTVDLMQHMGNDSMVVAAARVSTDPQIAEMARKAESAAEQAGLINYLMAHRHGTPFEHGGMTFRVEAPIFVYREWHRHRIGWSYNEESGRYKQLEPVFHIPAPERPLINAGTSARPRMVPGDPSLHALQVEDMKDVYEFAYKKYEKSLFRGVAKEVAREVLPVGIYSSQYATANPRSILAFLSLRTHEPEATFVSYPQYEIEQCGRLIEDLFAEHYPITYKTFVANGRVAP